MTRGNFYLIDLTATSNRDQADLPAREAEKCAFMVLLPATQALMWFDIFMLGAHK